MSERLAKNLAFYFCCSRWYGGQWSTGYRIMCRSSKFFDKLGIRDPWETAKRLPVDETTQAFWTHFRKYYRIMWRNKKAL
jgi:hypothetical protein